LPVFAPARHALRAKKPEQILRLELAANQQTDKAIGAHLVCLKDDTFKRHGNFSDILSGGGISGEAWVTCSSTLHQFLTSI
jgi:hypothetical protein